MVRRSNKNQSKDIFNMTDPGIHNPTKTINYQITCYCYEAAESSNSQTIVLEGRWNNPKGTYDTKEKAKLAMLMDANGLLESLRDDEKKRIEEIIQRW